MAAEAWDSMQGFYADVPWPADFEAGFKRGFCDLVAGSGDDTPINPPRKYAKVMNRGVDGLDRTRAWFDGYRHGSAVAAQRPSEASASCAPPVPAEKPAPSTPLEEQGPPPLKPDVEMLPAPPMEENDEDPFADQKAAEPEQLPPPLRVSRSKMGSHKSDDRFLMPMDVEPLPSR